MRNDPPADWFPNLYLSSEIRDIDSGDIVKQRNWGVPSDFWEHPERHVDYLALFREEMWPPALSSGSRSE